MLSARLRKKAWESFVFRKRRDWTIFFKAFRLEYLHCLELSAKSRAETGKKLLKTHQRSKPQNHDYYVEKHTKKHETWFLQKRCTNWNSSACLCISDTSNKVSKFGREVSSIRNTCELRQNHNNKPVRFSRISSLLHNREERCVTTLKRGCVVDYRISRVDLDQYNLVPRALFPKPGKSALGTRLGSVKTWGQVLKLKQ